MTINRSLKKIKKEFPRNEGKEFDVLFAGLIGFVVSTIIGAAIDPILKSEKYVYKQVDGYPVKYFLSNYILHEYFPFKLSIDPSKRF